jgi:hypothetical protein
MKALWAAVFLLVNFTVVYSQCNPPVGPSCVFEDRTAGLGLLDFVGPDFFQGIGNTSPGGAAATYFVIDCSTPGSIAAYDAAANCGFVFPKLLATLDQFGTPEFFLNGEPLVYTALAQVFVPNPAELELKKSALAELSRCITTGLKIDGILEIVGGIQPGTGGFFNVEVRKFHESEYGLLRALEGRTVRDANLVQQFVTDSLF